MESLTFTGRKVPAAMPYGNAEYSIEKEVRFGLICRRI